LVRTTNHTTPERLTNPRENSILCLQRHPRKFQPPRCDIEKPTLPWSRWRRHFKRDISCHNERLDTMGWVFFPKLNPEYADTHTGDDTSMLIATSTVLHRVFTYDKSLKYTIVYGCSLFVFMTCFIAWHCITDELVMHSVLFGSFNSILFSCYLRDRDALKLIQAQESKSLLSVSRHAVLSISVLQMLRCRNRSRRWSRMAVVCALFSTISTPSDNTIQRNAI
jgi:hypothetical protein